jgi:hypothetical protein
MLHRLPRLLVGGKVVFLTMMRGSGLVRVSR